MSTLQQETLSLVEQTSLPKISVKASTGTKFQAYVNAYVVGDKPRILSNGTVKTPLYYLSLVAMHGEGTTLQGIFSTLVGTHLREVHLEQVGDVALAHHQVLLASNGYTLHWNFEQTEVPQTRDLHAVIESNMLTVCDPIRGLSVKQRVQRTKKEKTKRQKEVASLSTAKSSKSQNSIEEIRNREKKPSFLLLVPNAYRDDATFVQQLHLSFLDLRVPWPLDPSWASYLWQRGIASGEIERLKVWSYQPSAALDEDEGEEQEEHETHSEPFLADAFFCLPKPALMQYDLQEAVRSGQLPSRLHSHLVALPAVPREDDIYKIAVNQ